MNVHELDYESYEEDDQDGIELDGELDPSLYPELGLAFTTEEVPSELSMIEKLNSYNGRFENQLAEEWLECMLGPATWEAMYFLCTEEYNRNVGGWLRNIPDYRIH